MASMFKVFTKTLEDGFFPVVLVDAINNKTDHFEKYWSLAKQKGFEVYMDSVEQSWRVCVPWPYFVLYTCGLSITLFPCLFLMFSYFI